MTTLFVADYLQTNEIADNPDKWHERNPMLGEHPDQKEVAVYFATSYAIVTAAAVLLNDPWREYWQYAVIGVEAAAVGNNLYIGLGLGF